MLGALGLAGENLDVEAGVLQPRRQPGDQLALGSAR
jgi:hypothetical protein